MPPDSKDPSLTLHVKGFDGFHVGRWTSLKTYSLLVLSAARKDSQELVRQDGTSMPGAAAPGKHPAVNVMQTRHAANRPSTQSAITVFA